MAGYSVELWKDFTELAHINQNDQMIFEPGILESERSNLFMRWQRAVEMSRGWITNVENPA